MSFSLSARKKLAVCWLWMVAIPSVVLSQSSFVSGGGEYSIAGRLPGDQVHPQLSFTTNGGYIVWQDNWIDGKGFGVGAMRLNSDLTSSGVPFRVDSLVANDQENAQVSMLNNGGAAFAWQGGKASFQHVFVRFLSTSNTWITGDVLVSSVTNRFQSSPAIVTLLNGNVVVVYASFNQAASGSLSDIFGQIFTPSGQKVGGEFLINQFTSSNQRSPALVALADGRFAVAWVSEQERWTDENNGVPSVDVYARIFDGSGAAVADEFLVNKSSNVCAYPALAASQDGGFIASWMEKDMVVRNNGWDIYARRFTGAAVGGNVTVLNTQLYGDQYSPQISRAGTNYLAVWTSLGQDGSWEGVYGRYLNDDATVAGSEFRVNSTIVGPQKHPALGSDGVGRFLAAWTSLGGAGLGAFDLFGQKYINPAAVVVGANDTTFDSDPNKNTNSVDRLPIDPIVLPPGNPTPPRPTPNPGTNNSFAELKGVYAGLVYDPNAVKTATSGYITITTTATPSFSGKLQMGGSKYSFSGKFDASGSNVTTLGPWTMTLVLDLQGGDRITGQITDGTSTALLDLERAVFSKAKPTKLAGNYTLVVQASDNSIGTGIGTATVTAAGDVSCSLTLADGTKITEKTTLSKSGAWPLYAQPYKTGGVVVGWMQFQSTSSADGFSGPCVWVKPAGTPAPYAGGLTNSPTISGALYQAPLLRPFGNSTVQFTGGDLAAPITKSVMWGSNNKIVSQSGNTLKLTLTTKTGLFKGTIVDPGTGKSLPFQGVLFEKNNVGLGFFPGTGQSGAVSFAPNP